MFILTLSVHFEKITAKIQTRNLKDRGAGKLGWHCHALSDAVIGVACCVQAMGTICRPMDIATRRF
jgi:hypothetical protein